MKLPRFRYSDLPLNLPFTVILDRFLEAKRTYYNRFIVFHAYVDVGLDEKHDYRECELSLPIGVFLRAFNELPLGIRKRLKHKRMRLKLLKTKQSWLEILDISEDKP